MNGKISVIIPVYNVERYLDTCVQAIVNQTYTDLEIILVDDGSPDNCGAMCDAWAERDSRIRVIHQENSGVSASRNAGLDIATGKWVTFVDADDVVSAYLAESLIRASVECPSGGDTLYMTAYSRFTDAVPKDNSEYGCKLLENNNFISVRTSYFCWGILYSAEVIRKVGLRFDPNLKLMEDEAWLTVYLLSVRRICFLTEPMYYYRQNPDSATGGHHDHKRWANGWSEVQASVLKWFAAQDTEGLYTAESREFYRHCQNKLINECVKGNLRFRDYRSCKSQHSEPVRQLIKQQFPAEYIISRYLPAVYYWLYFGMMKVRNLLR